MKKLFVSIDIAKRLRKLGFNEPCIARYEYYTQSKKKTFNLSISEISFDFIDNRVVYGALKDYNTIFYLKEGTISAPLYQQVIIWIYNNYNIELSLTDIDLELKIENVLKIRK